MQIRRSGAWVWNQIGSWGATYKPPHEAQAAHRMPGTASTAVGSHMKQSSKRKDVFSTSTEYSVMYTHAFCAVCRQRRWDIDINMHYMQSWTNAACALPSLGTRLNKGFTLQISLCTNTHTHTHWKHMGWETIFCINLQYWIKRYNYPEVTQALNREEKKNPTAGQALKRHLPTHTVLSILFQIGEKKCFPNSINNSRPSFSSSWWSSSTNVRNKKRKYPQIFIFPGFIIIIIIILPYKEINQQSSLFPKNFPSSPFAAKANHS